MLAEYAPALIAVAGFIGVLTVVIVGGQIQIGPRGVSFYRKEKGSETSFVVPSSVFDKIDTEIGQAQLVLYDAFLDQMKASGEAKGIDVCETKLDDYSEALHVLLLSRIVAYKGNGLRSIQSIIMQELKSGRWLKRDVKEYVRSTVMPQVMRTIGDSVNLLYPNRVITASGVEEHRIVDKGALHRRWESDEVFHGIETVVLHFFEYAEAVTSKG